MLGVALTLSGGQHFYRTSNLCPPSQRYSYTQKHEFSREPAGIKQTIHCLSGLTALLAGLSIAENAVNKIKQSYTKRSKPNNS